MTEYIHVENGLRVHVWETNKGHSLGLFRWRDGRTCVHNARIWREKAGTRHFAGLRYWYRQTKEKRRN